MSTTNADRHLPIRTCVGCRRRGTPGTLCRCVIDRDGVVRVSRTAPGRGAWVCGAACVAPAISRRGFERAWRRPVPISALDGLADEVEQAVRSGSTRHERLTTRVKG